MNKKLKAFIIIPIVVLIIGTVFGIIYNKINSNFEEKDSLYTYMLDDTTPQRMYYDSLNNLRDVKQTEITSINQQIYEFTTGAQLCTGPYGGFMRIVNARMLQPTNKESADSIDNSKKYFVLPFLGLKINDNHSRFAKYIFYTKNDSSYLSKLTEVPSHKNNLKLFHYSRFKKVNYIFLPQTTNVDDGGVAIQIKSNFLRIVCSAITYLWMFCYMYIIIFVVGCSLIIVFNISRGRVFISFNIFRLKWMAILCFASIVIPYFITSIFYLVYFKDFYPDVSFTHSSWDGDYKWCIAGIIYLLLFLAFRKGYKLQQEQDLTI